LSAYVFGYASLVAFSDPVAVDGVERTPVAGRLRGWRRRWAVAMDNWDAANDHKHFVVPASGERPRLRVAYPDIEPASGESVNGLALPADEERLAQLDAREVNYERVEVTDAFEPALAGPVFAFRGSAAARERCRAGIAAGDICIGSGYLEAVRAAFAALGDGELAEFERTTGPPPFPVRELVRVRPQEGIVGEA
jgi:hypothetical protein